MPSEIGARLLETRFAGEPAERTPLYAYDEVRIDNGPLLDLIIPPDRLLDEALNDGSWIVGRPCEVEP